MLETLLFETEPFNTYKKKTFRKRGHLLLKEKLFKKNWRYYKKYFKNTSFELTSVQIPLTRRTFHHGKQGKKENENNVAATIKGH